MRVGSVSSLPKKRYMLKFWVPKMVNISKRDDDFKKFSKLFWRLVDQYWPFWDLNLFTFNVSLGHVKCKKNSTLKMVNIGQQDVKTISKFFKLLFSFTIVNHFGSSEL